MQRKYNRRGGMMALGAIYITSAALAQGGPGPGGPLPPVPVPPQNPITESKRVLGKVLFWDEQLSTDNSISCGTCHIPGADGADPRTAIHPGADGVFGTDDDVVGSPGVIRAGDDEKFKMDPHFGLGTQVTGRNANPTLMAAYAIDLFWDGRADSTFVDPQTGQVRIPNGGGLESQALAPIVSDVEMGHEDRSWAEVIAKLTASKPLMLATDLPPDLDAVVQVRPTYPELFQDAFGDPAITAERIAFAIATYERTLIPNQTAFDAFADGNPAALTQGQRQGFQTFLGNCAVCHAPPVFSNQTFRNIGLRPPAEDLGRQEVTGNPADRGRFKVPSLRNSVLKTRLMHNGQILGIADAVDFYREVNGHQQFPDNLDPAVANIAIPPNEVDNLLDFVRNALVDFRVATEAFPFDRPSLHSEDPSKPVLIGDGVAGTNGTVPNIIAVSPPNVGNTAFKIGVEDALANADAVVLLSTAAPIGDELVAEMVSEPMTINADGYATFQWPIEFAPPYDGRTLYAQWAVTDPAATGGEARSAVAQLDFFCGGYCECADDVNGDEDVNFADLVMVLSDWGPCVFCATDTDGNGFVEFSDLLQILASWGTCP